MRAPLTQRAKETCFTLWNGGKQPRNETQQSVDSNEGAWPAEALFKGRRSPLATPSQASAHDLVSRGHLSRISNTHQGGGNLIRTSLEKPIDKSRREHADATISPSFRPESARNDKKLQSATSPSWKHASKDQEPGERPRKQHPAQRDSPGKLQRYVSLQEIKTTDNNQMSLQSALEATKRRDKHRDGD